MIYYSGKDQECILITFIYHSAPEGEVKFKAVKILPVEYEISDFFIDMVAGDPNDYDYLDWNASI